MKEGLWEVLGWLLAFGGAVGVLITVLKALGYIKLVDGVVFVGELAIGSGFAAGWLVGLLVAAVLMAVIAKEMRDRCNKPDESSECVAGVVVGVEGAFSSALDEFVPWRAQHDRVDIIVKSRYWEVLESGSAYVFCTDDSRPFRKSEIARCYFFDRQVCSAAKGALVGGAIGALAGIVAAGLIAAALCITVVLCVLGLILAAFAAAALIAVGAAIGGQIGRAGSESDAPTTSDTGAIISVGQLLSVTGPMIRRDYDDGANVIYWADSASLHGDSMSPQPYSYCDINDELAMDACTPLPIVE